MKDWVKPFVRQKKLNEIIGNLAILNKDEEENPLKKLSKAFKVEDLVYPTLSNCFNIDFSEEEPNPFFREKITYAFGYVLARLPQKVFNKLLETKNLIFTFSPKSGEIKNLFVGKDIITDNVIQIVIFPSDSADMPYHAIRGMISRELAYLFLLDQGYYYKDELKIESYETAKEWGFEEEIEALRKYNKQIEEQDAE